MTDSLFDVEEIQPSEPASQPAEPDAAPRTSRQSLSLYRKYRPQSFAADELFGQDHVVNTLRNAIRLDRIAHAYLFCGPRGTGKTTTARILAKAVNCLDSDPANRPCNHCEACLAINANATTDVIEIDAASNRGIDDIRELRERVKYAPTSLKTKFYIIDEAHQITGAAANAFLKTLEEPPAHTRFVLATTDPEELLQTIVSRCQRFDFRRIRIDAMSARLRQVAELEGIEINEDAITTIARHATGSLRDALGLLDQVSVYRDATDDESPRVTIELVRTVLGVSRNDLVEGLVRAVADHDPGAGLRIINDAVEAGEDIRQLGRQLIGYLRVLMLERASGSPDADEIARELAHRFELNGLARVATILADIDYKARHAAIVQLPLELAIIEACSALQEVTVTVHTSDVPEQQAPPPPRQGSGPSLKDRVRGASMPRDAARQRSAEPDLPQDAASSAPSAPLQQTASSRRQISEPEAAETGFQLATAASGSVPSGDLELVVERWDNIRMDVKALNRRTEALLQQADPLHVEGTQLTLVAAYPFHQKRLNEDDTRRIIEEVIERRVGKKLTVLCVSRDEAQSVRPQAATIAPTREPAPQIAQSSAARDRSSAGDAETTPSTDDAEPGPGTETRRTPDLLDGSVSDESSSPSPAFSSLDLDEERIRAAMNIFDAVIVDEE